MFDPCFPQPAQHWFLRAVVLKSGRNGMAQCRCTILSVGLRPLVVAPVGSLFASGVDRRQPETSSAILRGEKLRAQRGWFLGKQCSRTRFLQIFCCSLFSSVSFLSEISIPFSLQTTLELRADLLCSLFPSVFFSPFAGCLAFYSFDAWCRSTQQTDLLLSISEGSPLVTMALKKANTIIQQNPLVVFRCNYCSFYNTRRSLFHCMTSNFCC